MNERRFIRSGTAVNHGQLYPNLNDFAERGLLEKSELDKRTNQYVLTDDGYEMILGQLTWEFAKFVITDERAADVHVRIDMQLSE